MTLYIETEEPSGLTVLGVPLKLMRQKGDPEYFYAVGKLGPLQLVVARTPGAIHSELGLREITGGSAIGFFRYTYRWEGREQVDFETPEEAAKELESRATALLKNLRDWCNSAEAMVVFEKDSA